MKTTEERFWSKVQRGKEISDCWHWLAYCQPKGYGLFRLDGSMKLAHRIAYNLCVGPIPEGLQLDHLCRNPWCVNPTHLEVVTNRENVLRGNAILPHKHCPQGHTYDNENTYVSPDGRKSCRTCNNQKSREYRQRRREARAAIASTWRYVDGTMVFARSEDYVLTVES